MDQTNSPHQSQKLVQELDREFSLLHQQSLQLIRTTSPHLLFDKNSQTVEWSELGESIMRSAAVVEQTCGGLMSNLWDDPFEWTLPETLSSSDRITEYLLEVERTRQKTFAALQSDNDLMRDIAVPSGQLQPVGVVIIATLVRAAEHHGRSLSVAKSLSRMAAPGVII